MENEGILPPYMINQQVQWQCYSSLLSVLPRWVGNVAWFEQRSGSRDPGHQIFTPQVAQSLVNRKTITVTAGVGGWGDHAGIKRNNKISKISINK